jgi:hypothetical protein
MQGIAAKRADEIKRAIDLHKSMGGATFMLTLTLPHDAGDRLKPMRRQVARAWRYVQTGAPWKRIKDRIGFVGSIRALEVTAGVNGWHPHLHILLFTETALVDQLRDEFIDFVYRRWSDAITRPNADSGKVYRAPDRKHGVTLTESHRDDYLAKLGLADEVTRSHTKRGRRPGHRTPLQILADISDAKTRQARDVALWREYAAEMHGARQLTWSRGLRSRFSIADVPDEQLAVDPEATEGTVSVAVAIEPADWDRLIAHDVGLQLRILDAASLATTEYEVLDALTRLLDEARGLKPVPF